MVETFLVRSEELVVGARRDKSEFVFVRGSILAQVPTEGGEDRFVPPPTSSEATSTMMFAAGDNGHDGRILTGAIRVHGRSAHRQLRVAMPE
jgi:hypothetical protein